MPYRVLRARTVRTGSTRARQTGAPHPPPSSPPDQTGVRAAGTMPLRSTTRSVRPRVDADVGIDAHQDHVGDDVAGSIVDVRRRGTFLVARVHRDEAVGAGVDDGDVDHGGDGVGLDADTPTNQEPRRATSATPTDALLRAVVGRQFAAGAGLEEAE